MYRRQGGITMIGLLFLLTLVGLIVYAGIRLTPVYLSHMKVLNIMEGVKEEFDGQSTTALDIRKYIARRLDIEAVTIPKHTDFNIRKAGAGYNVTVSYQQEAPYISNLYLVAKFDNQVEIRR